MNVPFVNGYGRFLATKSAEFLLNLPGFALSTTLRKKYQDYYQVAAGNLGLGSQPG
jgi:hypothetical protein